MERDILSRIGLVLTATNVPGKKSAPRKARDFMAELSRFVASATTLVWVATSRVAEPSCWEEILYICVLNLLISASPQIRVGFPPVP
jgi:hypothetical protein